MPVTPNPIESRGAEPPVTSGSESNGGWRPLAPFTERSTHDTSQGLGSSGRLCGHRLRAGGRLPHGRRMDLDGLGFGGGWGRARLFGNHSAQVRALQSKSSRRPLQKETALPRTGPFPHHSICTRLYSPRRVPNNHDDSRAAGRSSAGGSKRETLGHRAERSDGLRWRKPRTQGADEVQPQGRVNANPGHRGYRSIAPQGLLPTGESVPWNS